MLHLRTLGAHDVVRADGSGLSLQRRPFALLAFVAAAGTRGVSREKALGVLWPDTDEERARHALAQTVYSLRRACGGDVIVGTTTLCTDPGSIDSDVAALAPAIAASDAATIADLYHGPFLDGFHLPNSDGFERWMDAERERLRAAVSRAYQRAASAATAARNAHAAVEWWRRAAALDPLDARVALGFAESLAESGDSAAAVKQAELHQILRRAELDLPPDFALATLVERLRAQPSAPRSVDPGAAAAATPALPEPATEPTPTPTPAQEVLAERGGAAVAPRPRATRRRWIVGGALAAIALGIAGAVMLSRSARPLSDQRVVVAPFEDRTGDTTFAPLGDMTADWIAGELARTGLVDVVDSRAVIGSPTLAGHARSDNDAARARDFARSVGAGLVVWGDYYRRGDTLELHAELTDARDGALLREIPPISVGVHDPLTGVQRIASRVMGALATVEDPRLAEWARRGGTPPSYDAYREFVDGLEAHVALDFAGAWTHYQRAMTLDSSFVEPLLFGADVERQLGAPQAAESLLDRVNLSRDRLTPADRDLLDFQLAQLHGDLDRAYYTARDMARESPSSESFVIAGQAAFGINHPREALAWFQRVDPTQGWVKGWGEYWLWALGAAHLAHDDSTALVLAEHARQAFPDRLVSYACMAIVQGAEGHVNAVDAELDSARDQRADDDWTYDEVVNDAALELAVHGHASDAVRVWQRALAWYAARPADAAYPAPMRDREIRILLNVGRVADALALARAEAAAHPDDPVALTDVGVAEARAGDTVSARAADRRIQAIAASRETTDARARVAADEARLVATLGDRARAVALIRVALKGQGFSYLDVHRTVPFERLRGFPPFDQLAQPRG